jgi:hypothetical protein
MEPRAVERFSETMGEEQAEPQTLSPYALDRTTGFYVKVRNVEGLLGPNPTLVSPAANSFAR